MVARPAFMVFEKIMRSGSVNAMARVDYRHRPQPKWWE